MKNLDTLLNKEIKCNCGKIHFCGIKNIVIESGAILRLKELTMGYEYVLLVFDENTYAVCGKKVLNVLKDKNADVLIYKSKGFLVPNEESIEKLNRKITSETQLIIGVGSGVINDLCKYVSFIKNIPYFIVATAPSVDGYASDGAALITDNMKVTYSAHVPQAIIGDVDILKNAPIDMIKSGYGDILGKLSCLNDWKLSAFVNNEYFCKYVYDLTYEMVNSVKDLGQKLLRREDDAVKLLMQALVGVGIAMAYVGNSRPASGSEHHLSHFFEVIGIMKNEPYFMHGTDVAFSSFVTQCLREKIINSDFPEDDFVFDEDDWENKIKAIYCSAADGVIELQKKLNSYKINTRAIYKDKFEEIKTILKEAPSSNEISKYLKSVELDFADFEKTYGKQKINNAIWFAKDLKDRYSVLWLYYNLFFGKGEEFNV